MSTPAMNPRVHTAMAAAHRRWRRSGRRWFLAALAVAARGPATAMILLGGTVNITVTASAMVLTAGLCACGAYCLGQAHARETPWPAEFVSAGDTTTDAV